MAYNSRNELSFSRRVFRHQRLFDPYNIADERSTDVLPGRLDEMDHKGALRQPEKLKKGTVGLNSTQGAPLLTPFKDKLTKKYAAWPS